MEGDASVELAELEAARVVALIGVEAQPARGHDGHLRLDARQVAPVGSEAEIVGKGERGEVARAIGAVAGLEDVVEGEAQGVGVFERIDGARVAEAERLEVGGEHGPVDGRHAVDFIGLDVCYSILKVLQDGFGDPKYAPCPLLTNMVNANNLGIKTGEGFYKYTMGNRELIVSKRFN